jgi:glycosyltransferase involved in cell wall biosynthesis
VNDIRHRFGVPDRYLLFVGTLEPRKNLPRLLDAHRRLGDAAPPLVIAGPVGWGDDALAKIPIATDRVIPLGHVPESDLPALYSGAELLCYPSIMEGFGLPILEAMSQGTPVLTSQGTSTEEVAGGAAVLVDPMSVESIAEGIKDALLRRSELSQLGQERAKGATWESTASLVVRAYRDAISSGVRR